MKQQVDVIAKITFEADAALDTAILDHRLAHWISGTMSHMDDPTDQVGFLESQVLAIADGVETYEPEPADRNKPRYFAFGKSLVNALEMGEHSRVKRCLIFGVGILYKFDGASPADLLAAYDGWDGFYELTESQYLKFGGN